MALSIFRNPGSDHGSFRLLTVCTGNICRSPLAESLLRDRLIRVSDLTLASAGLHAVEGSPMDEDASIQLVELGGNPDGLVGEQLTDAIAASADLILTMTLGQRNELVQMHPRATRRTFSIGEFSRLIRDIDDRKPLWDLVRYASLNRAKAGATTEQDVEDPYRRGIEVHRKIAKQISDYVDFIDSKVLH